jgi:hypothetical protein
MLVLLRSQVECVVAVIKKLSDQQIIGQQGAHLLGERLLSHGLSFQPTSALDAGIDGFLK